MGSYMSIGRKRMKKVVGASATALMVAALLTGCDNKCGISKFQCDPCDPCATAVECTPAQTSASVTRITTVTADAMTPCIAVMPFQCVEERPESGIIVAGALANSLSAIDGCVVYSPEVVVSRVKFKDGEAIDPIEVGKKLNAPYILTGRVTEYVESEEKGGQASVGVTARLIDSRTGQEIWTAKQYDEYMNKALGSWSDAVSNDLARAINLGTKEVKAVETAAVAPLASGAAEVEVDVNAEYDMPIDFVLSDSKTPDTAMDMETVRFGSDNDPADFGISKATVAPKLSAPVMDEYGVHSGSPLTARYGSPTLPTDQVGRILDQFEDPTAPRYIAPSPVSQTVAAVPETVEPEAGTAYIAGLAAPAPSEPAPVSSGVAALNWEDSSAKSQEYLQYHYTGANPFADGPGKKAENSEPAQALTKPDIEVKTVAETPWEEPVSSPEADTSVASREVMYMPAPPNAAEMTLPPPVPPEQCPPAGAEPTAFSDTAAMVAPELPGNASGEVMFMPEPLQMEPLSGTAPKEVKPLEDGTFKVTISAEQFLNGDEFDFFGSLSDKLGDMDDIEG